MNTSIFVAKMLGKVVTRPAIVPYVQPDSTVTNTGRNKMATRAFVGDTMHVGK